MKFIFLIIQLISIVAIIFSIVKICKKSIFETIPFLYGIILIIMYILAFLNHMELISYILAAGGTVAIISIIVNRKNIFSDRIPITFWVWLAATIVGGYLLSSRLFTAYDEYSFWAPSVKSLFSLNGFAAKGFEPVVSFGDYPPISQIAECLPCYMAGSFNPGLTMTGFYIFGMIYLLPLLNYFPKKISKWWYILLFLFLILFGSWGADMWFSRSPDVLMAIVYGYALTIALKDDSAFNLIEFILALSVLAIVKSIGIQWAIFAIIFWIIMHRKKIKNFIVPLFGTLTYLSWWIFCLTNERTTYLTQNLVNNVTGKAVGTEQLSSHIPILTKTFFKSVFSPLTGEGVILNLSLSWFSILVLLVVAIILIKKFLSDKDKKVSNKLMIFVIITGIVELGILLYSVLTMFLGEYGNYENLENMKILIQRYGSPVLLGTYILVIYYGAKKLSNDASIDLKLKNKNIANLKLINVFWYVVVVMGIITAPISKQLTYYTDYNIYAGKINVSSIETNESYELLVSAAKKIYVNNHEKVVLIQTKGENKAFGLNYLAAPVAIRYDYINEENVNLESIKEKLKYYKTDLFYIYDEEDGIIKSDIDIEYNKLYSLTGNTLKEVK